ncbi:MAG: (E)-4-hydroxy-3-methylbut-2-enyl-diphosphate synthase [Flavobacteriales bacterium]|nr:(E)-4-hydroxy-3-methylbut-2-enyl-diphosphate synthase [Flavobacteriales bacterium]
MDHTYCNSEYAYSRWKSRPVQVGSIIIGGDHPIRIQSMTTTDTMDTKGSVAQSQRMIEAGSELVRLTAPSKKEAENLREIKAGLERLGLHAPLVADIHFTPNAAEVAADYVEKIRVNPGNYADKKKFETHDYSDEGYSAELDRIRERFSPLVIKCKQLGRAMRIGTNHGSLSDRIMSRYGDTPKGMVESAMEFIRICREHDYHELVISMKSSNPQVMVQAYRLLVHQMMQEGMNYPLHLGVTEAGDGEDGRIKSAVGIGTLLEDGLGDTIRVSLTEEPEAELPVARMLAERYAQRSGAEVAHEERMTDAFAYARRETAEVLNLGAHQVPRVVLDYSAREEITAASLFAVGYQYSVDLDKWTIKDQACDFIYTGTRELDFAIPGTLGVLVDAAFWTGAKERHYPLFTAEQWPGAEAVDPKMNVVRAGIADLSASFISSLHKANVVLMLHTAHEHGMAEQRAAFWRLMKHGCQIPVIVERSYDHLADAFLLYASTDTGALLLEGLGDGIMLRAPQLSPKLINDTSFGILQATRTRISKTEYISCPSCGRTLFDLQETTARIRQRTHHLKGVKIGIMGCIVNGPGEMADADYGYVGTGPGKVTLYREKEVVKRNVPESDAVDQLILLIQEHGDWVDPV